MSIAWLILVLGSLLAYILFDGYDLGAGTISLFTRDRARREEMIEGVGGVWDGNETWLIMTGVALFAGFPVIFGVVLPHLYLPLIVMLLGLILRGFSIELISQGHGNAHEIWYRLFGIGSLVATLMQGLAIGALSTRPIRQGAVYQGGPFSWLSWFGVLISLTVLAAYVGLGYAWMRIHEYGDRGEVVHNGRFASLLAVVGAVVALCTVNLTDATMNLNSPAVIAAFVGFLLFALVGALLALFAFGSQGFHVGAYAGLCITTASVLLAFVVSHLPYIVPGITIEQASAPGNTYLFLIIGIGFNIPLIILYNWFAHHALSVSSPERVPQQGAETNVIA